MYIVSATELMARRRNDRSGTSRAAIRAVLSRYRQCIGNIWWMRRQRCEALSRRAGGHMDVVDRQRLNGGCTSDHRTDASGYSNSDKSKSIRRRDSRHNDELSSYLIAVETGELIGTADKIRYG